MFNPANLRIISQGKNNQNISSFVGIQRAVDGEMEFRLPFGFDDFPIDDAQKITKFFFSLYKTFQHFQKYVKENFERKSPKFDGSLQKESGYTFVNDDDESVVLSSKIANLESILVGYDELRIFSIVMRPKRTERIDYSQINKYFHQAIFLKNHVPYVDEMILPQPFIEYSITDLVRMYCFIYFEVKQQLEEEENVPNEIRNQAQIFREFNLQPDSTLFSFNHDFTIQLLRSALDDIHRQVSLKDDDYWHFYKALEDFLYGVPNSNTHGVFWGITSFAMVWEDMCQVYFYHNSWEGVWYADSPRFANSKFGGIKIFLDSNFKNFFYFNLNEETRYIRPDLVRVYNFDVQKWFDDRLTVKYPTNQSCQITLKKITAESKAIFNSLNYRIKKKFSGIRAKSDLATSHTYKAVSKAGIEQIIDGIKNEHKSKYDISDPPHHLIVDFKYVNATAFEQSKLIPKIVQDVSKQIIYEYTVSLNNCDSSMTVKSQFIVPYSFSTINKNQLVSLAEYIDKERNDYLKKYDIQILKLDFMFIQKFYNSLLAIED